MGRHDGSTTVTSREYHDYINSQEWRERRAEALKRSMTGHYYRVPACEFCGRQGNSYNNSRSSLDYKDRRTRVDGANGLHVHHLHYRTLGNEEPEDLIVLYTDALYPDSERRNIGCHEQAHLDPLFAAALERLAAER